MLKCKTPEIPNTIASLTTYSPQVKNKEKKETSIFILIYFQGHFCTHLITIIAREQNKTIFFFFFENYDNILCYFMQLVLH